MSMLSMNASGDRAVSTKKSLSFATSARALRIAAGFVLFIGIWEILHLYVINPFLLPSPLKVVETIWDLLRSGELPYDISVSSIRILIGYLGGSAIGIIVGLLIGRFQSVSDLTAPFLEFLRPLSPVALLPLVLIWFGIGESAKYILVGYTAAIIVLLNTAFGVANMPVIRARAARCLGASEWQMFTNVLIPTVIPHITVGMRTALGFSFMSIVAAEMIAADAGVGQLIMQSRILLQVDQTFAGVITLSLMGAVADFLFRMTLSKGTKRYQYDLLNV
jgi:ABC-type nitrate/sulfonate/bicarbonate transport system permease component